MPLPALLLLFVMAACGARSVGPVDDPAATEVTEDVAKAVEGALEQYRQAYEVRSLEALGALYQQDLDLVLIYQGRSHRGWTQVEAFLANRLAGASKVRINIKDLAVQELGPTSAMATAKMETTIGDDATTVTEKGELSLVFRKIGDKWMVVAEHFSYPTGAS